MLKRMESSSELTLLDPRSIMRSTSRGKERMETNEKRGKKRKEEEILEIKRRVSWNLIEFHIMYIYIYIYIIQRGLMSSLSLVDPNPSQHKEWRTAFRRAMNAKDNAARQQVRLEERVNEGYILLLKGCYDETSETGRERWRRPI